jgi:spermidine synthase
LVFFFLSGACGLVYEVVWMRMLTLVFGATAFATSTILASFFAGLALGAFVFGRVVDRGRNPLILYSILEAGVGIFAFLMPLLFAGLSDVYVAAHRGLGLEFYQLSLLRFALSFLILLVPATLMGGTLPVIIKFFAERKERLGWDVGRLYATNTFGAVVGTVLAGFFLILMLGVREAAYAAGAVNLLIALMVFLMGRRIEWGDALASDDSCEDVGDPNAATDQPRYPAPESGRETVSVKTARLVLWAFALSGFCSLALEVLWTRSLVFFLDNSTHAFTTILTAFLLGIALGSVVIARFIDRGRNLVWWMGLLEVLIGVSAILAIPILGRTTPVIQNLLELDPTDPLLQWKWVGMRFATTLTVIFVPTLLIGMTFPLVTKIWTRSVRTVGTALGQVYSANTLGGVLGSALAGFLLIPVLGVKVSIVLIAGLNVAIGILLMAVDPVTSRRQKTVAGVFAGAAFGGLAGFYLTSGAMNLTSHTERVDAARVLFYEEGIGATVKVFEDHYGDRLVSINGFPVAGTPLGLQDAQIPLAHLPLLLNDAPKPSVNLIGFGAGGASWGVMQYHIAEVDVVELVPAVLDAAVHFPDINHGVLNMPGYNAILGDGRNYALVTDKKYDVISVDATSPKMAGNGSLYALEFYELLKRNLAPGGVVVQWYPLHLLSYDEVRMTTKTFLEVFPHTSLWLTPLRGHAIILGTEERLQIDVDSFRRKLEQEHILDELGELNVTDLQDVLSWFVMGEDNLRGFLGEIGLNTDNHPILEFTPAMAYFAADLFKADNMYQFREHRESILPYLTNLGGTEEENAAFAEAVQRRYEATQHSLAGDVNLLMGRRDDAILEYNLALAIDPDDKNWMHTIWDARRPER